MCNWEEFRHACKKLSFKQDMAGAWRALDENMSGTISLSDIDPTSSTVLTDFRLWAVKEFGSVRSMFSVFDEDSSKTLSFKEFKRACRIYGFRANLKALFSILEANGTGSLTEHEVVFLDRWVTRSVDAEEKGDTLQQLPSLRNFDPEDLAQGKTVARSLEDAEWKDGDLHPAFRSWANRRRRRPVKKQDGSLPSLCSVDFGEVVAKRPILLLAYLPEDESKPRRKTKKGSLTAR